MKDKIVIGQLGGAFGVKGEVRLKSFCATPEAIADYGPYSTETGLEIATVILTGQIKNGFSARIDGITTKEEADALRGTALLVARDRLPSLPDDEFYYTDLMGLCVVDTGGTELGHVHAVQNHGATDLLEIRPVGQAETVLLPFTRANVPTVDLASGRVVIDPPPGIFS